MKLYKTLQASTDASNVKTLFQYDKSICCREKNVGMFYALEVDYFLKSGSFIHYDDAYKNNHLHKVSAFDNILFISHPWMTAQHPDPDNVIYKLAATIVNKFMY